tara:strand:+ start:290 stop:466 length:177 start_codon:yes stop_codon:yes gene_type:complete
MTKRKTTKKKINKQKENSDWFDTHVEVMGVDLIESKKIKSLLKERLTKDLAKSQYNLQ